MGQPLKDLRAEREAYYRRIAPAHLAPLWEMMPGVHTCWTLADAREIVKLTGKGVPVEIGRAHV